MTAGQAAPVVRAHKAVLDDDGRRVVVGWMGYPMDNAKWFCEVCRGSQCRHIAAVIEHAAGTGR